MEQWSYFLFFFFKMDSLADVRNRRRYRLGGRRWRPRQIDVHVTGLNSNWLINWQVMSRDERAHTHGEKVSFRRQRRIVGSFGKNQFAADVTRE